MATYTSLINSVLRLLREDEVASPTTSTYSELIGDLVNQSKREVEDAWKWNALRTTKTISAVQSTSQYSIVGAGKRFKFVDLDKSVYNDTTDNYLTQQTSTKLKYDARTMTDESEPTRFYIEGTDSNDDPYINLWPTPDQAYTIYCELVVPQADLSTGSTVLKVPEWPVILGAYAKALAERGEDNGTTHGEVMRRYEIALQDAISIDSSWVVGEDRWVTV